MISVFMFWSTGIARFLGPLLVPCSVKVRLRKIQRNEEYCNNRDVWPCASVVPSLIQKYAFALYYDLCCLKYVNELSSKN